LFKAQDMLIRQGNMKPVPSEQQIETERKFFLQMNNFNSYRVILEKRETRRRLTELLQSHQNAQPKNFSSHRIYSGWGEHALQFLSSIIGMMEELSKKNLSNDISSIFLVNATFFHALESSTPSPGNESFNIQHFPFNCLMFKRHPHYFETKCF
jgi:hypothetical protein